MKRLYLPCLFLSLMLSCSSSKQITAEQAVLPTTPIPPVTNFSTKSAYWQQHVYYKMEIDMDVKTYQYQGKQTLVIPIILQMF